MEASRLAMRWGHGLAANAAHAGATGGAPLGGGTTAPCRAALPSAACARPGRQSGSGDALEAASGARGAGRPAPASRVRAGVPLARRPVGAPLAPARAGGGRGRVRERTLDAAADRGPDRRHLRGAVPLLLAGPRLARPRLESPAAPPPRQRARRG